VKYEWFVAWRYLKAKRKVAFISVITFISIAGVTLGVMALLVVISVMNGFDKDLREKILGARSHLVIENYSGINDYKEVLKISTETENIVNAAPVIIGQGLIRSKYAAMGTIVKAIDPMLERNVTELAKNTTIGNFYKLSAIETNKKEGTVHITELEASYPGIIIGKEIAKRIFNLLILNTSEEKDILRSVVGEKVRIISPIMEKTPAGEIPRTVTLSIVGILDTGMYEYDSSLVVVGLETGQKLYNLGDNITRVEMKLANINRAAETAALLFQRISDEFGISYPISTWMDMNRNFFLALKIEKLAMFVILVLIILVGAFNIASTLIMVVMEKTKDIGILRSMGASSKGIISIFLIDGTIIGIIGTIIGCSFGWLICLLLDTYKINIPGGGSVYYIDTLPVYMEVGDFLLVSFFAVLLSFLASIYPARQAAKMKPVEAIRYE